MSHADRMTPHDGGAWKRWWALPLRLIVGYGFFAHGFAKLVRGPEHFTSILHNLGMSEPAMLAWATIVTELLGGLAILAGAFVNWVSLPMGVVLAVAMFTVHLPNGFSSIKLQSVDTAGAHFGQPGYETDLLYLAGIAALVMGGPGPFAVDHMIARARARRSQARSSARNAAVEERTR